jgi:transposase
MRGQDDRSGALFSYVDLESRVPRGHPLRRIRTIVNQALVALSGDFDQLYGRIGRPGVPPEKLLRALLLQAFYSIRSERQLMERLDFDLLFRWFPRVGPKGRPRTGSRLGIDDPVWDHSTFAKNRDRLLAGDVAARFMAEVLNRVEVRRLLSDDPLQRRRHADRGVRVDEELPATGRWRGWRRSFGRRAQPRRRLPRPAAPQRQPRLDHCRRCPAVPQG